MTWRCERCGELFVDERAYNIHKRTCGTGYSYGRTCRACNGTGVKVEVLGPNIKCPVCNGTGIA